MTGQVISFPREAPDVVNETSSTLKAFGVLEVLVRMGRPVTLSELMLATELPKPSLHRTLALFEEAGLLSREPDGRAYTLGQRLSRFGLDILRNDAAAAERRIILRRVVAEIGESCNLAVMHRGDLIYLDRIEADWPLRLQLPVGGASLRPHCCASGKLLLAHRGVAERDRLLSKMALERFTGRRCDFATFRLPFAMLFFFFKGGPEGVGWWEWVLKVREMMIAACLACPHGHGP